MSTAYAAYAVVVGVITSLVARRKGRSTGWWFAGGVVGGLPVLVLATIAPHSGQPWRSRAPLAIGVLLCVLLGVTVVIVALSHAHFTY